MTKRIGLVFASAAFLSARAVVVEVDSGEWEAVKTAAHTVQADMDRATPDHKVDKRRIVAGTVGVNAEIRSLAKKAGIDVESLNGKWESWWRFYVDGTWVVAGSDRRGAVYGLYQISEELGVSPLYWMDDIPVVPKEGFPLSTAPVKVDSPAVKYRGVFINDEDWCLRPWAVNNFEKDGSRSIGAKTYEKIFETMLRCRLNQIWPAMHGGGYEFVSRAENMELAEKMGIVVGTSHCEPMLRNNIYWNRKTQGEWNYEKNKDEIDRYWEWSAKTYGANEAVWTLGIRGIHDCGMAGGRNIQDRCRIVENCFAKQMELISEHVAPRHKDPPATVFIPYKEALPIYDAGLKVPDGATIMWVDDNFGYIRRLGGPSAASHPGGIYWHVSYFGGPHSYTHLCTTAPGFMWYELGAKCMANNASNMWMLNVGDFKPADIQIWCLGRIAWDPDAYGPDAQDKLLDRFVQSAFPSVCGTGETKMKDRIVRHLSEYYTLGTIRKPELMCLQWADHLLPQERDALHARYGRLLAEDESIESALPPELRESWFGLIGFQCRFTAVVGLLFTSSGPRELAAWSDTKNRIGALGERYGSLAGGKWRGFWCDTRHENGRWLSNGKNQWASQMQWPWNEPADRKFDATATDRRADLMKDAADFIAAKPGSAAGEWREVAGLGTSGRAMALLPVKAGVGEGAELEYEFDCDDAAEREVVLQFLPEYRIYPGMKLRVNVSTDGGATWREVEVPGSSGRDDENGAGRRRLVQDNFARVFLPAGRPTDGRIRLCVKAVDPGIVLDGVGIRKTAAVVKTLDIRDYGAVEGAKEKCTAAFAKAVEACSAAGGGRVMVPHGKWLTGGIRFKSNVEIRLDDGAEIVFSGDPADYLPAVRTTWEGFECMNYAPPVYAFGCTNVALTGKGTLTPRMETWREWFKQPKSHMDAMAWLYHAAATNMPVKARNMVEFPGANMRPNFIQFNRCKGVKLEGYRIRESTMWCQHILLCDDVTVRGVSVFAHGFNNDGIDIDGSSNVLVENCDFDQGDDVVVVKALRNQDGWRAGKPSENITIRNCRVKEGHALLAVGSEISGGVRNVLVEDCEMSGRSYNLIYLKTNRRRGGFIENITARNIKADAANSVVAIDTDIFYHWAKLPDYEVRRTPISGLDVSGVTVKEANYAVRINGDPDLPVNGVKISGLRVDKVAKESISVKNAHNVSIELE